MNAQGVRLLLRRISAMLIDCLVIVAYALLLFALMISIKASTGWPSFKVSPLAGQLLSLISLTIPVLMYSILCEKSGYQAKIGKRFMHIQVKFTGQSVAMNQGIIMRNLLKFLPWEIAHTGVHWLSYYTDLNKPIPLWIWLLLVSSQLLVFVYLGSTLFDKQGRTFYDKLALTRIVNK